MASKSYTQIVSLQVDRSADGWYALSSPEIKEFFMAGKDLTDLLAKTPEVLTAIYRLNYEMRVRVTPVESGTAGRVSKQDTWTRMPSKFAAVPLAA